MNIYERTRNDIKTIKTYIAEDGQEFGNVSGQMVTYAVQELENDIETLIEMVRLAMEVDEF